MRETTFLVKVKLPRPLLKREAALVEQMIAKQINKLAHEGGLSPEECQIEVRGPYDTKD